MSPDRLRSTEPAPQILWKVGFVCRIILLTVSCACPPLDNPATFRLEDVGKLFYIGVCFLLTPITIGESDVVVGKNVKNDAKRCVREDFLKVQRIHAEELDSLADTCLRRTPLGQTHGPRISAQDVKAQLPKRNRFGSSPRPHFKYSRPRGDDLGRNKASVDRGETGPPVVIHAAGRSPSAEILSVVYGGNVPTVSSVHRRT